jgi:hypothetical protein
MRVLCRRHFSELKLASRLVLKTETVANPIAAAAAAAEANSTAAPTPCMHLVQQHVTIAHSR